MTALEKTIALLIVFLVVYMALYRKVELSVSSGVCVDANEDYYTVVDLVDSKTYTISDPMKLVEFPVAGDTVIYSR